MLVAVVVRLTMAQQVVRVVWVAVAPGNLVLMVPLVAQPILAVVAVEHHLHQQVLLVDLV